MKLAKYISLIAVVLIFTLVAHGGVVSADDGGNRISGSNRYDTAVAVSQAGWHSADVVVLARGDSYADALAGVPLAYALDAPILLTRNTLPQETRNEIVRLGAKKVVILGGEGAVSSTVENILRQMGLDIERFSGSDRYDTAAKIARGLAKISPVDKAVVAYGHDFPDAMAAASYAAAAGHPILLVNSSSLPGPTADAINELNIKATIVAGGPGVISDALVKQLPSPVRVFGATRYDTSVELAMHFKPVNDLLYLATGLDFADAVTGGVLAAKNNSGILLVQSGRAPAVVQDHLVRSGVNRVSVLGGPGAVGNSLLNTTSALVRDSLTADEQRMLDQVNAERTRVGANPLIPDIYLTKVARLKSLDMIQNKYFSHHSPRYGSPFDMMQKFNVTYRTAAGENLAYNSSVDAAHSALMNSTGHRANILNPNFTHIGLGIVRDGNLHYITQMFIGR